MYVHGHREERKEKQQRDDVVYTSYHSTYTINNKITQIYTKQIYDYMITA